MSAEPNPFIELEQAQAGHNPFLDTPPAKPLDLVVTPPCGDRACAKAHRPNGEHYSADNSVRMMQLQEDGKVGAQFGQLGGARKKRNRRAAEVIAEMAAEEADNIKRVFRDGIDFDNPIGVRMAAAKEILRVEADEEKLSMAREKQDIDNMNKQQLVSKIGEVLGRLSRAGQISRDIIDLTDADVTVIDDDE